MKKSYLIIICFFTFAFGGNSSNVKVDSIENLIASSTDIESIAYWKLEVCKLHYEESVIEISTYLEELHYFLNVIEDDATYIEICRFSGSVYRYYGQYDEALKYDLIGLKRCEEQNQTLLQAKLLNNIGIDLYRSKKYNEAFKYFFDAERKYFEAGDTLGTGDCYNNIAMVYDDLEKSDSALYYYDKAQVLFSKYNDQDALSDILNNKAGIYYKNGDFETVLDLVNQSLDIQKRLGNEDKISYTLINIGVLYYSMGDYAKAIESMEEGLAIAEKNENFPYLRYGYKSLADAYASAGNYEKAYLTQIKHAAANDTIFNQDMANAITEMQTKYETDKIGQQLKLLQTENELAELQIYKGRILFITALIVLALILIIVINVLYQNKLKSKLNADLENKNKELRSLNATKNKFFAIVSHDIKNPLSGFKAITGSLDDSFNDIPENEIKRYIKLLRKSSDQLNELLNGLLSWAAILNSNKQINLENIILSDLIEEQLDLVKSDCDSKQQILDMNLSKDLNVDVDENMLKTIIRNILTNAIKFTPVGGKIWIKTYCNQEFAFVSIKDTGIGIEDKDIKKLFRLDTDTKTIGNSREKGAGLGLILVKEMADRCNINIEVKSEYGIGTEFVLSIPAKANSYV